MKNITFNGFCYTHCDGLYDPKFPEDHQSTGYLKLKQMVIEKIKPASLEEIERWETSPTLWELSIAPDLKYLRFLHPNLRPFIIENWEEIQQMQIDPITPAPTVTNTRASEILNLIDAYWKFDESQQPTSSWHDKQDLLKTVANLLNQTDDNIVTYPEWLTDEIRERAKVMWHEHKDFNDNKRVEAVRILQRAASDAGYKIGVNKAMGLLGEYCLK